MLRFGMKGFAPPKRCPDCGALLTAVELRIKGDILLPCKCGCQLLWSHPHVWRRLHVAGPLFSDRKIVYVQGEKGFIPAE
jgi:hypothetical protein